MNLLLQWLGGGFYLLNKIFLWISERVSREEGRNPRYRRWRTASWVVYLVGLPAWLLIFVGKRNWIAAGVEFSGAPSMLLGLVTALRDNPHAAPRWLDRLALASVPLGFAYSFYDFGGLTTLTQWLEIGLVIGFLVGTYQLAKEQPSGYLWFILMHISCGWLVGIQGYPWLLVQQVVSLGFTLDAYRIQWKETCHI